jgi:micrococcal nuclease
MAPTAVLRWIAPAFLLLLVAGVACHAAERVRVKWVADGDTIILADGRHVRYIGIDTPEIESPHRPAEPMADEARTINRELVEGKSLQLIYDRERKDRYGRTLAYVYRRDDGLLVNAELLRRGAAFVLVQFPNTSKAAQLLNAQREAMEQGRGIWRSVDRRSDPACKYLGNRRSMRFHTHDCPHARTISHRNRIRLNNQWEAFWQGYAPARQCIRFPQ